MTLPAGTYVLKVEAENYKTTTTEQIPVIEKEWNQLENPIVLTPLLP